MKRFWYSLFLLFSVHTFAQTISLNPSFGVNGFALLANKLPGLDLRLESAALQADGKLVVVGTVVKSATDANKSDFLIARLNKNGSVDNAFGSGGMLTVDFLGFGDAGSSVAITNEGKIIVAGHAKDRDGNTAAALVRLDGDGSLDANFGKGGKVVLNLDKTSEATAIAMQKDGKIVVGGHVYIASNNSESDNNSDFLLVRLKEDGTLDKSFGNKGVVTQDFEQGFDLIASVAIQNDGKILAGGDAEGVFPLVRYNANGQPDKSFGKNGHVFIADKKVSAAAGSVRGICIKNNGKIIVGYGQGGATRKSFGVACINANGIMDVSFGKKGIATADFGLHAEGVNSVALQPDGKIIAGGMVRKTAKPSNQYGVSNDDWDFALARFNADGKVDGTFGEKGKLLTSYASASGAVTNDFITKLLLQNDRLLAVGMSVLYKNQWGDPVNGSIASYQLKTPCKGNMSVDATSFGFKPFSIYLGYNPAATLQLKAKTSTTTKSALKNTYSYSWAADNGLAISPATASKPLVQITGTGTGNYKSTVTLTVTDANGCSGEKEFNIQVIDARCDKNKVLICKEKNSIRSIVCVSQKEASALLAKGASLGSCK